MSDIKAGDLVMVVKPTPCCSTTKNIGLTFIVGDHTMRNGTCEYCKRKYTSIEFVLSGSQSYGFLLSRLLKIDPPALPESIINGEEVTA